MTLLKSFRFWAIIFLTASLLLQAACTALVVGGAAAGAAVAIDRRTAGAIVEDENIELKFVHLYNKNERLRSNSHINATSFNGWLLLTGEAASTEIKGQIQSMAGDIEKVRRIFNEVKVAPNSTLSERSNDAYITSKVKGNLYSEGSESGYNIKVVTESRTVYLMGLVSEQEAHQASETARLIRGVDRVVKMFEYH